MEQGTVAHFYNPSYLESEDQKIVVLAGPGKKHETLSEKPLKQKGLRHDSCGRALA
jgi:hypothetical protein